MTQLTNPGIPFRVRKPVPAPEIHTPVREREAAPVPVETREPVPVEIS